MFFLYIFDWVGHSTLHYKQPLLYLSAFGSLLMEGNRCSFCNSTNLRWDYKNGIIVCENCGSVIEDIIFDEQPVFL
ncbi:TFIIB-type zinc ribbon-containing protein [Sulfuracidifex metallicus]|uniref:TFIIB-type zinc ribbon-containing protein n=1 Tax=Sulfuracidifex metallicus TaxID=47303 RepID=UPI0009FA9F7C|nr:TFIIB-type zinc ribbon-containing protein [Sulfuracidifex metallicus]